MKKVSKLIILLGLFSLAQVVLASLLFLSSKSELTSSSRLALLHNFNLIKHAASNNSAVEVESVAGRAGIGAVEVKSAAGRAGAGASKSAVDSVSCSLSGVFIYDFDNVMIVEEDGLIRESARAASGLAKGDTFLISASLSDDEVLLFEQSILSIDSLVVITSFDGAYLVAYRNLSFEDALLYGFLIKMVVAVLLNIGSLTLGLIAILGLNEREEGQSIRLSQASLKDRGFIIKIDKKGRILGRKNSRFQSLFALKNIANGYTDKDVTLASALSNQLPFMLSAGSKSGGAVYFRCIATTTGRGYKILAINETDFVEGSGELASQVFLEPITSLKNKRALENDLEVFLKSDEASGGIAIFNLNNLESLETLFSLSAKERILKLTASKLSEKYSMDSLLYFIDDSKFVIFKKGDCEALKRTLADFNAKLSAVIRSERNNMQIITDVTFLYIKSGEDYTLSELLEFSEYARINLKARALGSVITENFTKSKYAHAIGNKKELTSKIIESNSFYLNYQPQFSLKDNKLVAFESLVRLGEVPLLVQDFITISEASGYMLTLGELIMQKALTFAKRIAHHGVPICINLSPVQLLSRGFVDNFLKSFEAQGLEKKSIAFEITETFLMSDVGENIKKLKIIKDSGADIHLDDFGMGYSSLAYLKNIPIDSIKIDKEFIKLVDKDEYSRAIVKFIVQTARQLGKQTIAEGVETSAQLEALKRIGCDIVQGFFTGRPLGEEEAVKLVESGGVT